MARIGDDPALGEFDLALIAFAKILRPVLCFLQLNPGFLECRPQCLHLLARGVKLGLGPGNGEFERTRVHRHQHVSLSHLHVRMRTHRQRLAGDFRRHLGNIRLHIGVLGRNVPCAMQPETNATGDRDQRHKTEQNQAQKRMTRQPPLSGGPVARACRRSCLGACLLPRHFLSLTLRSRSDRFRSPCPAVAVSR